MLNKKSQKSIATLLTGSLLLVSAISCGKPATPAHDSETNAIIALPFLAWELYVVGAAAVGAVYLLVNQKTGESKSFDSRSEADNWASQNQSRVIVSHLAASTNPNAMSRPSSGSSSIPTTIANECNNQRRPNEGTCEQDVCYISPSAGNAAAARRVFSHNPNNRTEGDTCFVHNWRGNNWGSDPAHGWLPHYHMYEIASDGTCLKNVHFYYADPATFKNYKGRCIRF